MIAYLEADDAGYDAAQSREGGSGITISPPPVNTYRAEIEEFNSAIRENRPPVNNDEEMCIRDRGRGDYSLPV